MTGARVLRKAERCRSDIALEEVRGTSLYEFWWKFRQARGRLFRATETRAIMVTPSWSADCACVLSDKHSDYARSAVIAYWRLMPTVERHEALREALLLEPDVTQEVLAEEPIRTVTFGHSVFRMPPNRFLRVQGLVLKFDTEKGDGKGRRLGWALALMEMLVNPVLSQLVPL